MANLATMILCLASVIVALTVTTCPPSKAKDCLHCAIVLLKIVLWPHFNLEIVWNFVLAYVLNCDITLILKLYILCNVYPCVHSVQKSMYLDIHSCIYLGTLTFVAYTVEVNRGLVCKGTKAVRTRSGFGLAAPSGPRRINAFLTLSNFTSNSPQIVNFYQRFNLNCQLLLSINPKCSTFINNSTKIVNFYFQSTPNVQLLPTIQPKLSTFTFNETQ